MADFMYGTAYREVGKTTADVLVRLWCVMDGSWTTNHFCGFSDRVHEIMPWEREALSNLADCLVKAVATANTPVAESSDGALGAVPVVVAPAATSHALVLKVMPQVGQYMHGGRLYFRHHQIQLNGVIMRSFVEGSQGAYYAKGSSFDALVDKEIALFEKALGCFCHREG